MGGDQIETFSIRADAGITLGAVSREGSMVAQIISGGTHATSYKITCAVTTDQGRRNEANIVILVRDVDMPD